VLRQSWAQAGEVSRKMKEAGRWRGPARAGVATAAGAGRDQG